MIGGWYEGDGESKILASEIVRYVTAALGLEPPVDGATRDEHGVWHHPAITDADNLASE